MAVVRKHRELAPVPAKHPYCPPLAPGRPHSVCIGSHSQSPPRMRRCTVELFSFAPEHGCAGYLRLIFNVVLGDIKLGRTLDDAINDELDILYKKFPHYEGNKSVSSPASPRDSHLLSVSLSPSPSTTADSLCTPEAASFTAVSLDDDDNTNPCPPSYADCSPTVFFPTLPDNLRELRPLGAEAGAKVGLEFRLAKRIGLPSRVTSSACQTDCAARSIHHFECQVKKARMRRISSSRRSTPPTNGEPHTGDRYIPSLTAAGLPRSTCVTQIHDTDIDTSFCFPFPSSCPSPAPVPLLGLFFGFVAFPPRCRTGSPNITSGNALAALSGRIVVIQSHSRSAGPNDSSARHATRYSSPSRRKRSFTASIFAFERMFSRTRRAFASLNLKRCVRTSRCRRISSNASLDQPGDGTHAASCMASLASGDMEA
ncbi:hypothetical protein GGX14DRAFT_580083 [Mycena pura]|uniref:Uncharacterized protein n=1 Tax=Mycena pura TaxID=153505 RepID=A0AAD6Y1H6_9AGAR|nr:hypothetical protein GGX14DRAFT_580083 [Mycena pura]